MAECGGARGCRGSGCRAVGRLVPGTVEADFEQQQRGPQQVSQKPYRVGLVLLCVGALFNWAGLAQAYVEPMRYVGVGCILAGALLICAAVCRWLGRSTAPSHGSYPTAESGDGGFGHPSVHIISLSGASLQSKPPDYDSLVVDELPSYEDAIKLRLPPITPLTPAPPPLAKTLLS